jgi:uncharacterized protein (TIGR00369 family)
VIRERTVTWSDPKLTAEAALGMSGLDLLQGIRDGSVPSPPIAALVDFTLTEVDHGRIVMTLPPAEFHFNPIGTMHGGVLATLLDSVMGCAVHSTLAKGQAYTTLEIKVNYVRAVTTESGLLSAEGKIVHAGRRSAVADGTITDAKGRLCATASTTCLVFDAPAH